MLGLARALVATRGGTAVARARLAPRRVAPVRLGGRAHLATRIDVIDDAPAVVGEDDTPAAEPEPEPEPAAEEAAAPAPAEE